MVSMVRLISVFFVVLLSWSQTQEASGEPLTLASQAILLAQQIFNGALKFRDFIKKGENINDENNKGEVAVLTGLEKLDYRISEMHSQLENFIEKQSVKGISDELSVIQEKVNYVNYIYTRFLDLTETDGCIEKSKLEEFGETVRSYGKDGLGYLMEDMYNKFTQAGVTQGSLLDRISNVESQLLMCYTTQSVQQTLTFIYNIIVNAHLKAFAMKLAAWEVLEENTHKEVGSELEHFKDRIFNISGQARKYIAPASRELWRCDPDDFKEGDSYSKLQQIFQGMIINKMDTHLPRCTTLQCSQLSYEGYTLLYKPKSIFAQNKTCKFHCNGRITDCEDTGYKFEYCQAQEGDDRRYIGLSAGSKIYGEPVSRRNCRLRNFQLETSGNCNYCLCTCSLTTVEVDRYFSLKKFETKASKNIVITGLRLRLINHVFYIEIREGLLGKYGTIVPHTTNWRNTSLDVGGKVDFEKIIIESSGKFEVLPKNDQVYAVHWEQKLVYLDDIQDPTGDFVLTGLRFVQTSTVNDQNALKLEVRLSEFDYKTGEITSVGEYISNKDTYASRNEVELTNADNPVKKNNNQKNAYLHKYISHTGHYLSFAATNRKKDMGQFTIPFIDTQEIAPEPPTPLSGAGLYYRGTANGESGGFMGLKVTQYNIKKHFD